MAETRPLFIGVDPAQRVSGFAYRCSGHFHFGSLTGIEALHSFDHIAIARELAGDGRVYATIEYPTWRGPGTSEVRAAANAWMRCLKAVFGRKIAFHKVTPPTWQAACLRGMPKEWTAKQKYIYRAGILSGIGRSFEIEENAAAAICLCEFGEQLAAMGLFGKKVMASKGGRK